MQPRVAVPGNQRHPVRPSALGVRLDWHVNHLWRVGECGEPAGGSNGGHKSSSGDLGPFIHQVLYDLPLNMSPLSPASLSFLT